MCMLCGPTKVRSYVMWPSPPLGMLKFNVDGLSYGCLLFDLGQLLGLTHLN